MISESMDKFATFIYQKEKKLANCELLSKLDSGK